ncbi:MAG: three-Cys-motif partner protein TcmP [Magnetococcus sp. DMHC-1]|nr:three-Cys-motif partner protein TcmP [Magnetococcales bacterium]
MPAKGGYDWDFDNPPDIETHSLIKHEILRDYLVQYVHVVARNPRIDKLRIAVVDGFAGGGVYKNPVSKERHEGSPLIILRAIRQAENEINATRQIPLTVLPTFHFIEKDLNGFKCLSRMLCEGNVPYSENIHLHNKNFEDIFIELISKINKEKFSKVIFILDQYGYKNVTMQMLRNIFSIFISSEVIMTFAVDAMIDYYSPNLEKTIRNIGIERYLPTEDELKRLKSDSQWRHKIQERLIPGIFQESGASFYTPFLIRSADSTRAYCWIHLSKHYRAKDVMMGLHWEKSGRFLHYGGPGLKMFVYDSKYDVALTGQRVFQFDEDDRTISVKQLSDDLPKHIYDCVGKEGILFSKFLENNFNGTPATVTMLKEAFQPSLREKDILIIGPNGEIRKKTSAMKPEDTIIRNPQLRLPLTYD